MGNKDNKNIKLSKYSNKLVFSKYAGNLVGGAEISLEKMICMEAFGPKKMCSYLLFRSITSFGFFPSTKVSIVYSNIKLFDFKRFKYLEYFLNRKRILKELQNFQVDFISYGYWSAYLTKSNSTQGLILLLRSTQGFGISPNPYNGLRRVLYFIYRFIEYPMYLYWSNDFSRMLQMKPEIIANSNFIAEKFYSKWGVSVDRVEYPDVSIPNLKKFNLEKSNFILFVGDNEHKGFSIFKYLAKKLPNQKFVCYARNCRVIKIVGNVTIKPWSDTFSKDLIACRLLIVPSQWAEAYGRVSRERYLLGGRLLVSEVGGLPETVDYKEQFLVKNYRSRSEWLKRVKQYLELH